MATLTVKINERTNFGKALLALLEVGISEKKVELINTPNAETIKAIEDVQKGKTIKAKNAADLIRKLNS